MEKFLVLLGKGFAVIMLSIEGMHAFELLKPGAEVASLILLESELQVV